MSLPYDIARCAGTGERFCAGCRRTEPGHPSMQVHIVAALKDGECPNYIEPDRWTALEYAEALRAASQEKQG